MACSTGSTLAVPPELGSGGSTVLVDEPGAGADSFHGPAVSDVGDGTLVVRGVLAEGPVGAVGVVVAELVGEQAAKLSLVPDDGAVEEPVAECADPKALDRTLIWNQRQLRRLLEEYVAHYNRDRPHRSLDQHAHDDATVLELPTDGRTVQRHTTCAGLISEYRPAA